ncbi:hypothetical protein FBY40_0817 [Microbacterium sp. SLBN-154]|uniref:hypothetical protein n=1 Tax=Microbacterium sp. SLBN-154 TaxID=2768458 RepID=UPI001150753E|nr:hypothetical protein [Microbacterium sp. SLBN-154]TQK18330.1 hypothetical protein FBY40_0817 [Microbacterium sp. SLBN-154]
MIVFVVLGVALGAAVGIPLGRRIDRTRPPQRASALAWTALALGIVAVGMLASALFLPLALPGPTGSAVNSTPVSIVLSMAGVTAAVWAIARGDRRWVSWTAGGIAAVPTVFWTVFALGYLIDPNPASG